MGSKSIKDKRDKISLIIESLIDMIKYPNAPLLNNSYFYHNYDKKVFIIYLYLFKLLINDIDYLEKKYESFREKFISDLEFDIKSITNIECIDAMDLLFKIKDMQVLSDFDYDEDCCRLVFKDGKYVDVNWFLTFMAMLLDNVKNKDVKEINICYTIPNKDIVKVVDKDDRDNFLKEFTYYSIKIKHTDNTKEVRENNILVVKNAAINYLKHLKQYKHGLESEESYKIFYNLLKNECMKCGFECLEETTNLLDVDVNLLGKIENIMDEDFYNLGLSRQVHTLENLVWQSSNDITLLEHMNKTIDSLVDLLSILHTTKKESYADIKKEYGINDIHLLLVLIANKFLITYQQDTDEIDYSILNLTSIKPKYMNSICRLKEQEFKNKLKSLNVELVSAKKDLEKFKSDRAAIDPDSLGEDKYKKELEICVSNINRVSIVIARLNSKISSISKQYDDLKKEQKEKYRNALLYNYNHSIIRHIVNSIMGCSFYLKTNNSQAVFSNIIIFEDYERTDNSFYLEVSFKELLKISSQYMLNGIMDQNDLPKLA